MADVLRLLGIHGQPRLCTTCEATFELLRVRRNRGHRSRRDGELAMSTLLGRCLELMDFTHE